MSHNDLKHEENQLEILEIPIALKKAPRLINFFNHSQVDATKCKAYGPGIEEPIIGRENVFTVDTPPEAGKAPLTCTVESPSGKKTPVKITDNGKGGFDVAYKPEDMGPYKINVKVCILSSYKGLKCFFFYCQISTLQLAGSLEQVSLIDSSCSQYPNFLSSFIQQPYMRQ